MTILQFRDAGYRFLASREFARAFREKIERALLGDEREFLLDFTGIDAITDSFADELLGTLIARSQLPILEMLRFKGCNPSVRSAIEALLADVVSGPARGA